MPPAAAMAIPAAIGAGGSVAGGKKGNSIAKQQLAMQQQVFNAGQQLVQQGMQKAWTPAANYWSSLMQGGAAAAAAVGPYADQMRQQGAATSSQLAATTPAGGAATNAQLQNTLNTSNSLNRLTAGVQPTAAQALGGLASIPMGAGGQQMSLGAPNIQAGLKNQQHQQQMAMQGAQGFGNLIYNAMNKQNGGSGGSGGGGGGGAVIPFSQGIGLGTPGFNPFVGGLPSGPASVASLNI